MPVTRRNLESLDRASAYYVLRHAEWRIGRGKRKASVPYGGIRDPRLALGLAASVVGHLSEMEKMKESGERLLQQGKNFSSANEDELGRMVHYVVENSGNSDIAIKCLLGMLDIPRQANLSFLTLTIEELSEEFQARLREEDPSDSAFDKKVVSGISSQLSTVMVKEIFRARGGMVLKDGTFGIVTMRGRHGEMHRF